MELPHGVMQSLPHDALILPFQPIAGITISCRYFATLKSRSSAPCLYTAVFRRQGTMFVLPAYTSYNLVQFELEYWVRIH
jgi:hypothetical protein